jgi:hypothetical protein
MVVYRSKIKIMLFFDMNLIRQRLPFIAANIVLSFAGLADICQTANATTLNGQTITGLNINNVIYNVTFVDGTYNSVYATEPPTFLGNYQAASFAVETIRMSSIFQSLVPPGSNAGFFVPATQRILDVGTDAGIVVFDGPFWTEGIGCGIGGCGIGNGRTNEFPVAGLSNTAFTRFTRIQETTDVPEPTSIFSTIAVIGLGFASLKRKLPQNKTRQKNSES